MCVCVCGVTYNNVVLLVGGQKAEVTSGGLSAAPTGAYSSQWADTGEFEQWRVEVRFGFL